MTRASKANSTVGVASAGGAAPNGIRAGGCCARTLAVNTVDARTDATRIAMTPRHFLPQSGEYPRVRGPKQLGFA